MKRRILFYSNHFLYFYNNQDAKSKEKIDFVLDLIRNVERVPIKFLKYLEGTDGLYEIRVITASKSIRIFTFFEEGNLIIILNCFIKKTNKTPKGEIRIALKLKEEYYIDKMKRKKQ